MKVLIAWIGLTDLRASEGNVEAGLGPIGQAVDARSFDKVLLISNLDKKQNIAYRKWLADKKISDTTQIEIKEVRLSGPTEFGEIYREAVETISDLINQDKLAYQSGGASADDISLTFHLSPGTPAMAAVWIIIAKTRFPAELIESSRQAGVRTVSVPFDLSAEFIPEIIRQTDSALEKATVDFISTNTADFTNIIYQSQVMNETIEQARTIAVHNVPVLIEGESGTGKELFAKAIHLASSRRNKPFITVNCGAISAELVESELFGHIKGSFTGADKNRLGFFREADKGTIFLDEIGELPLRAQVKLLRVLQEKEITPVGASRAQKIDVRVISATNRNLLEEVRQGNFREDLFYRLAVFPIYLPQLRERSGDISLLVKFFLEKLNRENTGKFWKKDKSLTSGAMNILLNHPWTGNVRELQNSLLRACVLTKNSSISDVDLKKALFVHKELIPGNILNRQLGDNFNLANLLSEVARHYLERALSESGGNKSKAARSIGLSNYQTFDNWVNKYNSQS